MGAAPAPGDGDKAGGLVDGHRLRRRPEIGKGRIEGCKARLESGAARVAPGRRMIDEKGIVEVVEAGEAAAAPQRHPPLGERDEVRARGHSRR